MIGTPDVWVPSVFSGWDSTAPCPPKDATFSIGRTMYETDDFPQSWIPRLKKLDQIWVPTRFHQNILVERHNFDITKVKVVHQAVDTDIFSPTAGKTLSHVSTFRFLSIFKWEERKGWEFLLKAFCLEFDPVKDDVELVIKTSDFYLDESIPSKVDRFAKLENLDIQSMRYKIMDEDIKGSDLPSFYNQFDAYVTPTRGEGWGRPIVEAMSTGLRT